MKKEVSISTALTVRRFRRDAALTFVRKVLRRFEKFGRQRSNCPRCKGSGSWNCQKSWLWSQPTYSSEPCWFCEGIGVMPLFGLNGFFMGRAAAVVRTKDLKASSRYPPIKVHLCLGKYPDTKCKLRAFRPSGGMSELVYRIPELPPWLVEAATELAKQVSVGVSANDDQAINVLDQGSDGSQRKILRSLRIPGLNLSTLASHFDPTPNYLVNADISISLPQLWTAPSQENGTGHRFESEVVVRPGHSPPTASMLPSHTRHSTDLQVAREIQTPVDTELHVARQKAPGDTELQVARQIKAPGDTGTRSYSNFQCARLTRRNHIRSKAEKELIERSRRMERLNQSRSEESASGDLIEDSDAWVGAAREIARKWIAEDMALRCQIENPGPPKSKADAAPNLPFINQQLFARVVDKFPFIPKFVKLPVW